MLGDVLAGTATGRSSDDEITAFDSTGLAIQDLAIAKAALERADGLDLTDRRAVAELTTENARGLEEVELRSTLAQDRPRDELAADEAEHVAVPRVAGGDPEAVVPGTGPTSGNPSGLEPKIPAQRCVIAGAPRRARRRRPRGAPGSRASRPPPHVLLAVMSASRWPPTTSLPSGSCCQ